MEANPLDDYLTLSVIGQGSYAKVLLVRKKQTGQLYALKSMKKKYIEKKNQTKRILMEKEILTILDHMFLVKIHSAFQDEKKLYLVLEYCPGGQLFGLLSRRRRLKQNEARFYAAQVLLAIEYLHNKNIIYRDLKPENILICADGYIKLTDFGLSKTNIETEKDAMSVCGTPEYLAPEVIKKEGHGKAVDWWCLGALIYELVHGLPPFYTKNRSELFEKIKTSQPHMSKTWSEQLKDLFKKLFTKDPLERLKYVQKIKEHPWFQEINWQELQQKVIKPPFVPILHGQSDVSNFGNEFTSKSLDSQASSFGDAMKLQGFSYENSKGENSPPMAANMKMDLQQIESEEEEGVIFALESLEEKVEMEPE